MDVSVIVAASTTSTRDTHEHATIGELADAVAQTHDVAGEVFTLKIDGTPIARSALVEDVIRTAEISAVGYDEPVAAICESVIELIEITPEQDAALENPDAGALHDESTDEPQPTNPDGTLIPTPDGTESDAATDAETTED